MFIDVISFSILLAEILAGLNAAHRQQWQATIETLRQLSLVGVGRATLMVAFSASWRTESA
jgi:hypothetical protein